MANWHLDAVEISGGFLADLRLQLPPGLVCVIGPRGSGKSTLAEALRLALCGLPQAASKERLGFLKANLGSALITLTTGSRVGREGYTVRRNYGQPASLTTRDNRPVQGVDLDRGSFLPIDIYTSLEIEAIAQESVGDKRRALLDELAADDMHRIQLTLAGHRRTLEANADAITAARKRIADLRERIEELGDVRARLAALPPAPDHPGSAELQAASAQREANLAEAQAVRAALDRLRGLRAGLLAAVDEAKRGCDIPGHTHASRNRDITDGIGATLTRLWQSVDAAVGAALGATEAALPEVQAAGLQLAAAHAGQEAEYTRLQQQNQEAMRAFEARGEVARQAATVDRLQGELAAANAELADLLAARRALKADFLLARDQVSELREAVAARLQTEAGRRVQIRVQRNADALEYQQLLLTALQGSKTKNQDEIVTSLSRLRPDELAQLIQENDLAELDTQCEFGPERGRKILDALRERLNPLTLEVLPINDRVRIELNVAGGAAANFKDAAELSRGQKCTALLPILLARRESPLVIDQPEDNLDNHFIYETVVDSIARMKAKRQMVFVTHNANIPVLGGADLVVVMNSDGDRGYVQKAGSVDECRREIIDLLEGGEEAFQLRRRRYGN